MTKGVVHAKDHKRTYVRMKHRHIKGTHAEAHLKQHKEHIVPAHKKKHHKLLEVGDEVHVEIDKINHVVIQAVYVVVPLLWVFGSYLIALLIHADLEGLFMLLFLGSIGGILNSYILHHHAFRELDFKIQKR